MIKEGEAQPYMFLKLGEHGSKSCPLSMSQWVQHLEGLCYQSRPNDECPIIPDSEIALRTKEEVLTLNREIEQDEVERAILAASNGKAPRPDRLAYEHIKESLPLQLTYWVALFNHLFQSGIIVPSWHSSFIKVLFKGKGDRTDPNSYRGLALNSVVYKTLTRVLSRRLLKFTAEFIPANQFGFLPGKSTIQAAQKLLTPIIHKVYNEKKCQPVYAIFIDYTKAFDSVPRDILLGKLIRTGVRGHMLQIIRSILQDNYIQVDDANQLSDYITQNIGLLQGDSLSPYLFILTTSDLPAVVLEHCPDVQIIMYADDVVLWSESCQQVQDAVDCLVEWSDANRLSINAAKTKAIKFRRGGRLARSDALSVSGKSIEFVNHFPYLGIELSFTAISFTHHVQERKRKALVAITAMRSIDMLSLGTALKLFQLKIAPMASYGMQVTWPHLTIRNLEEMDKIKATFLKRCLKVAKTTRSRLAYALCREPSFIEDLRNTFNLDDTPAYNEFVEQHRQKQAEISDAFRQSPAMVQDWWQQPEQTTRHVITRFSCHGFHHLICQERSYHEAGGGMCICTLCGEHGIRVYHLLDCPANTQSLAYYAQQTSTPH